MISVVEKVDNFCGFRDFHGHENVGNPGGGQRNGEPDTELEGNRQTRGLRWGGWAQHSD